MFFPFFVCDLYYGHSSADCLDENAHNMKITLRVLLLISGYTIFILFWGLYMIYLRYLDSVRPFKLETLKDYEVESDIWFVLTPVKIWYFIWLVVIFFGIKNNPCSNTSISNYLQISTWFKLFFWLFDYLMFQGFISPLILKKEELFPVQSKTNINNNNNLNSNNNNLNSSSSGYDFDMNSSSSGNDFNFNILNSD